MSDGMSTGLGKGVEPRAHERADDEKTTLEQAERWALALGTQLAAPVRVPGVSEPTSDWRASAGDLTPAVNAQTTLETAHASGAGSAQDAPSDTENRMIVRVDGGDLGEVALVVDRRHGAIRVTINAADAGAEAALGLERAALIRALESHGITVDSVNVVRGNNFGTVVAPRTTATNRTRESSESESTSEDEHLRRRNARKLNLIG